MYAGSKTKRIIWLVTTPEELRDLAGEMEKKIPTVKVGDSTTVRVVQSKNDEDTEIRIAFDQ